MINYKNILDILKKENFSNRLLSLYRADSSIMFEDVVSEIYLHCFNNDTEQINDEFIFEFLKNMHSNLRKNNHSQYIENIDSKKEDTNNSTHKIEDLLQDKYLLKNCKDIEFTNEEIICLLYLQNKKNIKNCDYTFIQKNNEKSVDKNKLRIYYEKIINKLLEKLKIELLEIK